MDRMRTFRNYLISFVLLFIFSNLLINYILKHNEISNTPDIAKVGISTNYSKEDLLLPTLIGLMLI